MDGTLVTASLALRALAGLCLALGVLTLAGCAGQEQTAAAAQTVSVQTVSFRVAPDTNDNRPVLVELARVPVGGLVDELLAMKTDAWFDEAGERFRTTHADSVYDYWEVVPGEETGPYDVGVRSELAAVLFCDVGERLPMRFERDGDVLISVSDDGCTVGGGCASREPGLFELTWVNHPCAGRRGARSSWPSNVREVAFETAEGANGNAPVTVELVRTGDDEVLEGLLDISTDGWFGAPGKEFRLARPNLLVNRWELPPGGSFGPFDVRARRGLAGVLFCQTASSLGPVLLDRGDIVVVDIGETGCAPTTQGRNRWWFW